MIYDVSNVFTRFPDEMDSRFDFLYYHPSLDDLAKLSELTDHEVCDLGKLLRNDDGITSGTTPRNINYVDAGVPFLGATNIQNGKLDISTLTYIPRNIHENTLASSQLLRDDVLISIAGHYIGKCCIYSTSKEANINQAIARVRPVKRLRPAFLTKYLNSKWGQLGFLKYRHDVGQPNINLSELRQLPIIVPHPDEQLKILDAISPIEREARFFSDNAAKVRSAANTILPDELGLKMQATDDISYFFKSGEETSSLAFAAYDEYTDNRLHYLFFHPRFRVLRELQNRFSCTTLSADGVLKQPIQRGEQPEYEDDGEILVLKTVDLKNGQINTGEALRISREFYDTKPTAHIQRGDVLIASTGYGSLGKVDIYADDSDAMVDGHVSILRAGDNYDPYFLVYYLRSYLGQLQIEKWFSGSSGQVELQPSDIGRIIIPTPDKKGVPLATQKEIAAMITARLRDAQSLEQQAAKKWCEARETFEKMLLGN